MKKAKKGQIALIVLLVMVIMLTVGLAVISRTVTEIKISEHNKEAVRAFSAAEAGIEEALKDISAFTSGVSRDLTVGDLTAKVTVSEVGNNAEIEIRKNGSTKIDLSNVDPSFSDLTVYWVKTADSEENPGGSCSESSTPASLEIIVYQQNGSNYGSRRYAYNACSVLSSNNDFSTPDNSSDPNFLKSVQISINPAQDKVVSIRALYNKTSIKLVGGGADLPIQQYRIVSRAVTEGGAKALEVSRTVSILPEIFDFVLFSGGNLTK